MEDKTRVLVMGLDGASFDLVNRWAREGKLPTVKGLIERGTSGILKSTIPPISVTAWASFMTGKNPGKHGILDFTRRGRPVHGDMVDGRAIWEILSEADRRVGVINVPMTYPPREVNGFLIGGFPLPADCEDYTYPPELAFDLLREGWNLTDIATQAYSERDLPSFLEGLYRRLNDRFKATLYLMGRYPDWDFLMVHVFETDKVQHDFWSYMVEKERGEKGRKIAEYGDVIVNFFQKVDQMIGQLLDELEENVLIVLMSDHGFGSCYKIVQLNKWLYDNGFIKFKSTLPTIFKKSLYRSGLTANSIFEILPEALRGKITEKSKERYYSGEKIMGEIMSIISNMFVLNLGDVDWNSTKAYHMSHSGLGHVFVNRGIIRDIKEYEKIVNQTMECLRNLRDSENNEFIVDNLYQKERLYWGKYLGKSADVIVTFKDFRYATIESSYFTSNRLVNENPSQGKAVHEPNGLFVMWGRGVKRGVLQSPARLIDLAPTILYAMGVEIPRDMDGKVLMDCFTRRFRDAHKVMYATKRKPSVIKGRVFTREEEERMLDQLRSMGYI